jgi:hypothetical protein
MITTAFARLAKVAGRLPLPRSSADLCAAVGIAAVAGGVTLIYLPAGLITLGSLLLVLAVGLVRVGGSS